MSLSLNTQLQDEQGVQLYHTWGHLSPQFYRTWYTYIMKIILGSKSPWRKKVLEDAGYSFDVMTADIDEKAIRSEDYKQLPILIARAKAKALIGRIQEPAILITSDQIVVCNNELREKPESKEQAKEYLQSYGTYPPQTYTSMVVTNTVTKRQEEALDIVKIFFKPIPEKVIDAVIEEGKVMHTSGGFMTEHPLLEPYIECIEGSADSVLGLPLKLTEKLIRVVS